jgi:putative polyketide hydroxylase
MRPLSSVSGFQPTGSAEGDLIDVENGWQTKMGGPVEGAVLVRPDGFVAWRTSARPTNPEPSLVQVLTTILCRSDTG